MARPAAGRGRTSGPARPRRAAPGRGAGAVCRAAAEVAAVWQAGGDLVPAGWGGPPLTFGRRRAA